MKKIYVTPVVTFELIDEEGLCANSIPGTNTIDKTTDPSDGTDDDIGVHGDPLTPPPGSEPDGSSDW